MNGRILEVLEYNKIIAQLMEHTASSLGKEKTSALKPSIHLEEVVKLQNETDEAAQVLRLKGHVPLGGIFDIKPSIKRTMIGGILSAMECLDVASTIYGGRQLKRFIEDMEEPEMPILRELIDGLVPLTELERRIKSCVDEHGTVMDGASERLRTIRSRIRTSESRVRDKLDGYTKSKTKMLSDAIVTIRNERYVLPVKQEYRGSIGGIVHDQSASGATLFIEPQSVVDVNNQLQQARVEEKQEVERILAELSQAVAEEQSSLYKNVDILGHIDFMFFPGETWSFDESVHACYEQRGTCEYKAGTSPSYSSARSSTK